MQQREDVGREDVQEVGLVKQPGRCLPGDGRVTDGMRDEPRECCTPLNLPIRLPNYSGPAWSPWKPSTYFNTNARGNFWEFEKFIRRASCLCVIPLLIYFVPPLNILNCICASMSTFKFPDKLAWRSLFSTLHSLQGFEVKSSIVESRVFTDMDSYLRVTLRSFVLFTTCWLFPSERIQSSVMLRWFESYVYLHTFVPSWFTYIYKWSLSNDD